MKIHTILAGAALIAIAPLATAQGGGVAVLDIDRVAKELNVDQAVLGELKKIEVDLNAELGQIRNNLQLRMNQFEAQAGQQQRSPQDQQRLVAANQQLNQQFNQEKAKAQNLLAAERVKRINEFREKLQPIALAAAKERGLAVVLTKSPQLYAFVEAVDITEDVIKAAKAAGLEAEAPPAPPATAPATPAPASPDTGTSTESGAGETGKPVTAPVTPPPAKPKGGGKN